VSSPCNAFTQIGLAKLERDTDRAMMEMRHLLDQGDDYVIRSVLAVQHRLLDTLHVAGVMLGSMEAIESKQSRPKITTGDA
jgi:exosome complex RNA-binding protein Rrp4